MADKLFGGGRLGAPLGRGEDGAGNAETVEVGVGRDGQR